MKTVYKIESLFDKPSVFKHAVFATEEQAKEAIRTMLDSRYGDKSHRFGMEHKAVKAIFSTWRGDISCTERDDIIDECIKEDSIKYSDITARDYFNSANRHYSEQNRKIVPYTLFDAEDISHINFEN